jgi:hypothetical protein
VRPVGQAFRLLTISCFAISTAAAAAEHPAFSVRWISSGSNDVVVEVSGLDESALRALRSPDWQVKDWPRLLSIHIGEPAADVSSPSMLGSYQLTEGVIRFRPMFPLEPGGTYRAIFHPAVILNERLNQPADVVVTFRVPDRSRHAATTVAAVYPGGDELPENLLKFYLHFSAPMRRGDSYSHVRLLDASGKPIALPFLELDEELWNPEMTRLTLFIDPGRIKRGVRPLEEVGPALESGKRYTLEIDAAWRDADGLPLRERFRKSFRVGDPDRQPVDPTTWKLRLPKAGSRDRLVVDFGEPMEHALALRMIRVIDAAGRTVEGTNVLSNHEQSWIFTPRQPWTAGRCQLGIKSAIEDLAGNNIGKPFDVDLFDTVQSQFREETVKLSFEVRDAR